MKKILSELLGKLDIKNEDGLINKSGYSPLKLNAGGFNEIVPTQVLKTVFIDGGNQEVIGGNNFSLSLLKISRITMFDNKKVDQKTKKYYCLTILSNKEGSLVFETSLFNEKAALIEKYEIDSNEESITIKNKTAQPSTVCELIRRELELKEVYESIMPESLIVLDGNFEAETEKQKEIIITIKEKAKKQGAHIVSVAKTNQLFTKNGLAAQVVLEKMTDKKIWYHKLYSPLKESDPKIYLTKLSKNSKHSFRTDILISGDDSFVFYNLSLNSKDPVFLGYPYGLIVADAQARVTNEEKESEKTRTLMLLGKKNSELLASFNSKNAHDILDKIRY